RRRTATAVPAFGGPLNIRAAQFAGCRRARRLFLGFSLVYIGVSPDPDMYSTCLFCHEPLGSNDTFETFPVGRRLAFDGAKGRLWVVCKQCERWNLSP